MPAKVNTAAQTSLIGKIVAGFYTRPAANASLQPLYCLFNDFLLALALDALFDGRGHLPDFVYSRF
jgi:hypothetical protein